ncbi:uncharacterized protein LOC107640178 [Arachis ipaensis]|uniref:uncharacterized protein LOC107640178 n=1 Tax=Arachis ipaensis TaxID=130454 RepID=UPI0007AF7C01|nr:uncharacterized protein LOC107640178 [Arachis ipaensis]
MAFYKKNFPESVREAKELELMQLKQGSLFVADYTSRFEEFCSFSRVCQGAPESYESWKCIKYQGGLRDNIMMAVAPLAIRMFLELVNKARVVEECAKKVSFVRDTRDGNNNRGRGKFPGHLARDWTHGKNPNAGWNQYQGRVFAVNANNTANGDPLMRGKCLFGDKILVALYDTGASYSFIAFDKVEELGLKMSELAFDLHVHTPYQTVVTKSGCRKVSYKIEDREFVHDLICLPMVGLEMILGGKEYPSYMLLAANALGDEHELDQILVVRDFSEIFPEDIPKFLPQRKIEFAIDLVRRAEPVSIAPYRMAPIELAELKT